MPENTEAKDKNIELDEFKAALAEQSARNFRRGVTTFVIVILLGAGAFLLYNKQQNDNERKREEQEQLDRLTDASVNYLCSTGEYNC